MGEWLHLFDKNWFLSFKRKFSLDEGSGDFLILCFGNFVPVKITGYEQ